MSWPYFWDRQQDWDGLAVKGRIWWMQVCILAVTHLDPSNSISPRFNHCPIFMIYNDATNIHRLYMSKASNATIWLQSNQHPTSKGRSFEFQRFLVLKFKPLDSWLLQSLSIEPRNTKKYLEFRRSLSDLLRFFHHGKNIVLFKCWGLSFTIAFNK